MLKISSDLSNVSSNHPNLTLSHRKNRKEISFLINSLSKEAIISVCKVIHPSIREIDSASLRKRTNIDTFFYCMTTNSDCEEIELADSQIKIIQEWQDYYKVLKVKNWKQLGQVVFKEIEDPDLPKIREEIEDLCTTNSNFLKSLPNSNKFNIIIPNIKANNIIQILLIYASKRHYVVKYDGSSEFIEYKSAIRIKIDKDQNTLESSGKINTPVRKKFEKIILDYLKSSNFIQSVHESQPIKQSSLLSFIQNPPVGTKKFEVKLLSRFLGLGEVIFKFDDYSSAIEKLKETNFVVNIDLSQSIPRELKTDKVLYTIDDKPFRRNN